MISVHGLKKSFGGRTVLDGLTFEAERGTIFALLGENGAGKTTAVRILATLLRADAGKAAVAGFDCAREPEAVRRKISLTGQYAAVDELLTGEENLRMMGRLYHLDRQTAKGRADRLLETFELKEAAGKPVKTYSGGMRRKLDIALGLLSAPEVVFLDEPTTGLDPRSRMKLWEFIRGLARAGATVLLTTQYLEEADRLADRVAVLHRGQIAAEGTAEQLKRIVGKGFVELAFPGPTEAAGAVALLGGRMSGDRLRLPVHSGESLPAALRLALNRLHEAGIEPAGAAVREPTLDDVFLGLTGGSQPGGLPADATPTNAPQAADVSPTNFLSTGPLPASAPQTNATPTNDTRKETTPA